MAVECVREIGGTVLPLRGDDIDTDRIIPARFLKSITFDGLEQHLFEDDRREAEAAGVVHAVNNPAYRGARVLLVNSNFGCGSSREHAPQAIYRHGIRAVLGQSFSEIFLGNSIALGMPCPTASPGAIGALMDLAEANPALALTIDLEQMKARAADRTFEISLPAAVREAFLDGSWDATGLLLDDYDRVRATADSLPYVTGRW
jgi:3-isopropylmalate/(R)-2-methylmalate dehydratase small subunit